MRAIQWGILGVTTMLVTMSPQMAEALEKIGVVGIAGTTVTATGEDGKARTLKAGDEVFLNDRVVSDAGGEAQLIFLDRSTLTLKSNTDLTLDTYVYDPKAASGTMAVSSVKGAFRFVGGALSKKQPVTIKTPVATIGIRGGIADTNVQPGTGASDAVFVYGEELSMTNQNGETSTTTQIGTGLMLDAPGGSPVPMPPEMVSQRMQAFGAASPDADAGNNTGGTEGGTTGSDSGSSSGGGSGSSSGGADAGGSSGGVSTASSGDTGVGGGGGGGSPIAHESNFAAADGIAGAIPGGMEGSFADVVTTIAGDVGQVAANAEIVTAAVTGDESVLPGVTDIPQVNATLPPPPPSTGDNTNATGDCAPGTPCPPQPPVDEQTNTNPPPITEPNTTNNTPPAGSSSGGGSTLTPRRWGSYEYRNNSSSGGSVISVHNFRVVPDTVNGGQDTFIHESPDAAVNNQQLTTNFNRHTPGLHTVTFAANEISPRAVGGATPQPMSASNANSRAFVSPFGGMAYVQLYDGSSQQFTALYGDSIKNNLQSDFTTAFNGARDRSVQASSSAGFGGISFYNFLPNMKANHTSSMDALGFFNYNLAHNGLLTGFHALADDEVLARDATAPGMLVDWQTGVVLGLDVEFIKSGDNKPSATVMMGRVDSTGGGQNKYLGGTIQKYVGQDPAAAATTVNTKGGEFKVGDQIYGRHDKPIEGFAVDYGYDVNSAFPTEPWMEHGKQGAVLKPNPGVTPAEIGPRTGGAYKGFAGGAVRQFDAGNHKIGIYSNTDINDVSMTQTAGSGTVEASISTTKRLGTTPSGVMAGTFGSASDLSKSAYGTNKLYAAEQTGGTVGSRSAGFIVSGAAANVPAAHECLNCQYTQWGVWAAQGNTGNETSVEMMPYVVGTQVTQNFDAAMAASIGGGTATYNGAAYGTFATSSPNVQNASGTMNAVIDLNNRQVQALDVRFDGVQGSNMFISNGNVSGGAFPAVDHGSRNPMPISSAGNATFNAAGLTNGAHWNGNNGTSSFNGALFGPQAQEVGGNFSVDLGGAMSGGGVYHGAR